MSTITLKFVGDPKDAKTAIDSLTASLGTLGSAGKTSGDDIASGQAKAQASLGKTDSAIQKIIKSSQGYAREAATASQNTISGNNAANASFGRIADTLDSIKGLLRTVYAAEFAGRLIKGITDVADAYTNIQSKLRNVTSSQEELNSVSDKTFAVAQKTRSDYAATVSLYQRLTRATVSLNLTDQERLDLTETINKAYQVSGATTEEARRSVIQLTQALARGTFQGQDYNSVAEQGPIILDLLGRSLNKTRGELKAFAAQGGLTTQVVVNAIREGGGFIDEQFAKVTVTIDGALTRVSNAFTKFIGQTAASSGATHAITSGLSSLANNLDNVVNLLFRIGEAFALVFAGRQLGALSDFTSKLATSTLTEIEATNATRALLAARLEETQVEIARTSATLLATDASKAQLNVEIAQIQATIASAEASMRATAAMGAQSAAIAANNEQNAIRLAANVELAATTAELNRIEAIETATKIRNVAATEAAAVANAELAAAQTATGAALGGLAAAGSRALAFIGGWPTVVLAAAYATYQWITSTTDLSQSLNQLTQESDRLENSSTSLKNVVLSLIAGEQTRARTLQELASEQRAQAEAETKQLASGGLLNQLFSGNAIGVALYAAKIEYGTHKINELDKAMGEVRLKQFTNDLGAAIELMAKMFNLLPGGKPQQVGPPAPVLDPKKIKEVVEGLHTQVIAQEALRIKHEQGTRAAIEFTEAEKAGVDNIKQTTPEIQRQTEKLVLATLANENYKEAVKGASAADRQHEADLRLKNQIMAEAFRVTDQAVEVAARLADGLRGPVAKANEDFRRTQLQLNEGLERYNTLLLNNEIGLDEYTAATDLLNAGLENSVLVHNKALEVAQKTEDVGGEISKNLQDEIDARGKSTFALAGEKAVQDAANKADSLWITLSNKKIAQIRSEATAYAILKEANNYSTQLQSNIDLLKLEQSTRLESGPILDAEVEIRKLMAEELLPKEAEARQKVIDKIRLQAAEEQKLQAIDALGKDFTQIFNQAAQSVANGESAFKALEAAAIPSLKNITSEIVKVIESMKKGASTSDKFGEALSAVGAGLEAALPAIGQLVGTIAGGGGTGAQTGAAIGGLIGSIIGTFILPGAGTAIGGAIGSIIGGVVGGQGDGNGPPRIYASSIPGSRDRADTPGVTTPFGVFAADTDNLSDDAYKQFEATVKNFDIQLAKLMDPAQLDKVQEALKGFSGKFSDINALLQARFDVILSTFGQNVQDFVNGFATDLQGRVQALADVLTLQKFSDSGQLIVGTLDDALTLINEYSAAGERVLDTYNRLVASTNNFQNLLNLLGDTFTGTDVELVKFSQDLADALGGNELAAQAFNDLFDNIYDPLQRAGASLKNANDKAADSLQNVGLASTTTVGQFRLALAKALPTLSPQQLANWIEAGAALGRATAAQRAYNQALEDLITQSEELVDKLYGGGTLDDVNQQIDEMTSSSHNAANSVQGFGRAMTQAADAARNAISLLLGDLSPLNDQQKLQTALQGLYAGTVTKEQVLEIGRRLYASSQAYVDLFNLVKNFRDPSTATHDAAQQEKDKSDHQFHTLAELQARRDELEKQQRLQQAQQLAQNVAELATVQHKSYQEIADLLGFKLSDLATDLGLNSDALTTYLDNISAEQTAIPDSITTNTDRQITAMYDIADRPIPAGVLDHGLNNQPEGAPAGHSGHAAPARPTGDRTVVSGTGTPIVVTTPTGTSELHDEVRGLREEVRGMRADMKSGNAEVAAGLDEIGDRNRERNVILRSRNSPGSRGSR